MITNGSGGRYWATAITVRYFDNRWGVRPKRLAHYHVEPTAEEG